MADPLALDAAGVPPTPFEIPGARGQFRIQVLNEDAGRGVVTSIVHIPPGGFIPAHFHRAGPEMHYVLEGELLERGQRHGPGAFLTQAAGVVHGPHESEGGARVLTVQHWQSRDGQFDFHMAEATPATDDSPRAAEGVPGESREQAERNLGGGYG
ncbi:cupin domain-containing protein [Siccirubricoccus sp. KC 17139]|uniref:Cupin domain-containing protein n=1 Tax=Siccirubricoccus soli TaxID=2899147 RepID=A0ABT1DDB8_9PROT|nr:cupin domain-containing protein [Siccirubricoccus soli]MCO6419215.1 cupin domain-containing protein [Siccirubricoccus soli]MCP2685350.1 cupin domain-containing protein [Siccirubricoccus soli]